MENQLTGLQGVWLPLITPFHNGELDEASLVQLVQHYLKAPIDGLILAATTGEGMTLDEDELERLVNITANEVVQTGKKLPIYLGLSGSDTRKLIQKLVKTEHWSIDGYLIACPYYTRPSQEGLYQHFLALAQGTKRPVIIYNIPYRTGVNLENEQMFRLAEVENIVGVKDCCADPHQSFQLISNSPDNFSVLTGEDALFFSALVHGANGGITASAHAAPDLFADIFNKIKDGDHIDALSCWKKLSALTELFFAEPSPSPIKYWLWREGLIASPEVRLPMLPVSECLAGRLDIARSHHNIC
jgi:4-hydroxy-tetrahydrodipicolinate synthase